MLNKILSISLNNRLIVMLLAIGITIGGLFTVRSMDVDIFPDLTAPTVTILTEAHGLEAEEVERLVTFRIETELNGSPNVRRIRSSSAAGISIVWIEFDWGTDIYKARQIVSEKLPSINEELPIGIGNPTLAPISSIMGEVMLLSVSSDSLSPMQVRTLADWEITPRIKAISGVANVIVIGGDFKQYQVLASPQKMDHFGVSLQELTNAVNNANDNASGGFYSEYGNQYVIKGEGRVHTTTDIGRSLIKNVQGYPVRVSDVAEVCIGAADKIGDGSMNGNPSVIVTISKQPQTNTLKLTDELDIAIAELQNSLPDGIHIHSHIFRQANFIEASINNLQQTLLEGAFFVVIVLFIFLMNWRTTIISLVAIPLSMLTTFLVLQTLGYTINTMSLGGMAIAIGALVDDAIIDVENVFKRLRENYSKPQAEKQSALQVIYQASIEIRSSIVIATLIIIVSFVPLFFLGGMEGRLLQPLGIAFVTSVLTSLVVAVTITPVLCSYLLNNEKLLQKQLTGTKTERILSNGYQSLLLVVLKHPRVTVGITVIAFTISLFFATRLGRSFLPQFNEGSLVISVVGMPSMSLEESNTVGKMAEKILLDFPEIDIISRRTGRAESDEHAQGVNASEIDVPFTLANRNEEAFLEDVRSKLTALPGVNVTIGMPIAHRVDHMLSGTRANIAIKIFGPDLGKLFQIGKSIENQLKNIGGLADIAVEQQVEVPQIRIRPKRELLTQYGLTIGDFTRFIDVAFAGHAVSNVYEGQRYFDLIVRYDTTARGSLENLKHALVDLPNGAKVALSEIAEIESVSSPNRISRENVQRKVVVSVNVAGTDLRSAVLAIQQKVQDNINLPDGYRVEYGGQFESEEKASRLLWLASILAIAVIFVLLYYEFHNLKLATIVLLNLPLALIGGILIVSFTSGIISIATTIGFISLFGIATRNGILLISKYQDMEQSGMSQEDVLIKGATDRLNPILMTALTTALALIPLALKGGEPGNEIQSPMAVVILGGLLTATFLNLFVIPSIYKLSKTNYSKK